MKGEAIIEAKVDFAKELFDNFICLNGKVFCSGIFVFSKMLVIKVLAPNNPVSKGRRGWFKLIVRDAIPRKPARRNIINAMNFLFFSFSVKIKNPEIRIRIIGIILRI